MRVSCARAAKATPARNNVIQKTGALFTDIRSKIGTFATRATAMPVSKMLAQKGNSTYITPSPKTWRFYVHETKRFIMRAIRTPFDSSLFTATIDNKPTPF
jgi:hypothetical protein